MITKNALAIAASLLLACAAAAAAGSGGSSGTGATSSKTGTAGRGGITGRAAPVTNGNPGMTNGDLPSDFDLPAGGSTRGLDNLGSGGTSNRGVGPSSTLGPGVMEIPDMGIGGPGLAGVSPPSIGPANAPLGPTGARGQRNSGSTPTMTPLRTPSPQSVPPQ